MADETAKPSGAAELDELVVRAKKDRAAFSRLYECYYPEVSRYCLRRLLVRSVAEDVISEVFLQVTRSLPLFPGKTNTDFRRWLFRIATNAVNFSLRQSKRRQDLWLDAARSGKLNSNDQSSSDSDLCDWPKVYHEIGELDERDRNIIMLRFFSNCSYDEIASVVDASPTAVRTALSRVLSRLREKFKLPAETDVRLGSDAAG